jgi:hypothetical protein
VAADAFANTLGNHFVETSRRAAELQRANLEDHYRDVEGSSLLSDPNRYAEDAARDIEGSSILSSDDTDHERRLLEDPDYLRRAIEPEPYKVAADGPVDALAYARHRARALLSAADSAFYASVGFGGSDPDKAYELYLKGQEHLSALREHLDQVGDEVRSHVLAPGNGYEPRGGHLFAAEHSANMALHDVAADESRGAGSRFLNTYFTKRGMTDDERLLFIAGRPDAGAVFEAVMTDLGRPQPFDGRAAVRAGADALILASLPWRAVDLRQLSNRVGSGHPYNVSTAGMTAAERQAVVDYAQRTNAWLAEKGPVTVQSTAGQLRSQANAAARTERLNAAREGRPYTGQVGHVPDTALSGTPQPPAGWLDMPGRSNSVVGGGLSSRIGTKVNIITIDGKVP